MNPASLPPFRAACAALLLALVPACGKRGDPQAPLPRTPRGVTGLFVAQRGQTLEVRYVAPRATTGGVALTALEVELLRADTEGEFADVAREQRRKGAPGETLRETVPLPPPGTQVRLAARARASGHVSPLSSVVALTVQAPLAAPKDLKAELTPRGVALTWTAPPGGIPPPIVKPSPSPSPSASPAPRAPAPSPVAGASPVASPPVVPTPGSPAPPTTPAPGAVASPAATPAPSPTPVPSPTPPPPPSTGYWIYRRDSAGAYDAPLVRVPLQAPAFTDETAALGQSYCYVGRLVASTDPVIESESSNEACVAVKDVAAPAAPEGVAALVRDGAVEVSWSPSSEPDLAHYRVYRAKAGAAPERAAEVAAGESAFRDSTLEAGVPYTYTVTAVDAAGNESPPSAPAEGALP